MHENIGLERSVSKGKKTTSSCDHQGEILLTKMAVEVERKGRDQETFRNRNRRVGV